MTGVHSCALPISDIAVADGTLTAITNAGDAPAEREIDLEGGWLLPGFVDTQVNGGGGVLFNDQVDVDAIAAIGAAHARFGTTAFLPTLISDTPAQIRSEEHTSELQSLMRISYAVFCLKKKKYITTHISLQL